jgi:hypothetical protein
MFADPSRRRAMVHLDDYFLVGLVEFAERGLSLPILVSVGGVMIEGILISEGEYFELLSEYVQAASPARAEQAEHLREVLRGMPTVNDETAMRPLDEGADPEEIGSFREALKLTYIHLRDTRVMLPGGGFVSMAAPWRGKQSAIDGYWLEGVVS